MKAYKTICMALLLTACATNPPARYMKNDAGEDDFADMTYQCKKKTQRLVSGTVKSAYGDVGSDINAVNCVKFNACMASNGFIRSTNGRFVIRNDKEIDCKE